VGAFQGDDARSARFPTSIEPISRSTCNARAAWIVARSRTVCADITRASTRRFMQQRGDLHVSKDVHPVVRDRRVGPEANDDALLIISGTGATPPLASFMLETGQ